MEYLPHILHFLLELLKARLSSLKLEEERGGGRSMGKYSKILKYKEFKNFSTEGCMHR
jgi:hypothetical protein